MIKKQSYNGPRELEYLFRKYAQSNFVGISTGEWQAALEKMLSADSNPKILELEAKAKESGELLSNAGEYLKDKTSKIGSDIIDKLKTVGGGDILQGVKDIVKEYNPFDGDDDEEKEESDANEALDHKTAQAIPTLPLVIISGGSAFFQFLKDKGLTLISLAGASILTSVAFALQSVWEAINALNVCFGLYEEVTREAKRIQDLDPGQAFLYPTILREKFDLYREGPAEAVGIIGYIAKISYKFRKSFMDAVQNTLETAVYALNLAAGAGFIASGLRIFAGGAVVGFIRSLFDDTVLQETENLINDIEEHIKNKIAGIETPYVSSTTTEDAGGAPPSTPENSEIPSTFSVPGRGKNTRPPVVTTTTTPKTPTKPTDVPTSAPSREPSPLPQKKYKESKNWEIISKKPSSSLEGIVNIGIAKGKGIFPSKRWVGQNNKGEWRFLGDGEISTLKASGEIKKSKKK